MTKGRAEKVSQLLTRGRVRGDAEKLTPKHQWGSWKEEVVVRTHVQNAETLVLP